ncbi:MAG: acyl-ACP--UDP-N-acetylglucosamine O-acyltransferase [Phycisphaerales bacterium]|nr:acyl-ACP--UDP-N-acetylglucosamine O-acyltransferase [Phycisphaerales bacterium]
MPIHPTAIVDKKAEIDPSADIGPYVIIDGPVRVGAGTVVMAHAYLTGWTEIGRDCQIHPGAVVGHDPQDLAFKGQESYCRIGDGTIIREIVTIHRGTKPGSATEIGRRCFLMAASHVAHNCKLDDDVKLANGVLLAGYVHVGAGSFVGGNATVHQFVRIGELVMVSGLAGLTMDLPPYMMAAHRNQCVSINVIGLRRAGFTPEQIKEVRQAYRLLYRSGMPFGKAIDQLANVVSTDAGRRIVEFIRLPSTRGILSGRRARATPQAIEHSSWYRTSLRWE